MKKIGTRFLVLLLVAAFALSASPALAGSPPGAPSSVSVSRSDGALTASWPAVSRATSYHVTYSSDNGRSWSLAALDHPSSSISFGVANSKTYVVGVRAKNDHGGSGWVNSAPSGPYNPPKPPATPGVITVSRSDGEIHAFWNSVGGATSYHVTYTSDNGKNWSLAALNHPAGNGTTDITITGVDNDKPYIVGVRSRNSAGDSGWRNSSSIGRYEPPKPLKPAPAPSVAAERQDGVSATVKWTAYAGTDFSHYQVIVCTDEQYDGASCSGTVYKSGGFYDAGFTGPVSVTGLDAQTGYGVILQTWRTGDAVHKSHATIPALPDLPVAPDGLTVTPGNGNLTVSWNAVTGATGYDVRSSTDGSSWTTEHSNVSGTSVSVADANGEIEQIGVRAHNANGAGPWTVISRMPPNDWLASVQQSGASAQSAQGQSQLAAPTWGKITRRNATPQKLYLNWTAVPGASGYNVICSDLNGWSWWQCGSVDSGSTTSLTIDRDTRNNTNLGEYRAYKVGVRAVTSDPSQASDWTTSANIRPLSTILGNLTSTRADGSITMSWTPAPWGTGYLIDCAVHVPGQPAAYTRCATLTNQDDTDAEHSVTISSWTAGGNNYTIDNTKTYDIQITITNEWGQARRPVPLIDPITLTASNVSATTATLTLANYTGSWWLKPTSPSNAACESMGTARMKNLSTLTEGTSYTYKAYSDSACTNEIVSASFTTDTIPSVSNLGATTDGFGVLISSSSSAATGFATGGNSGNYTLQGVTVKFRSVNVFARDTLTVAIHAVSGGNPAASATHTLSGSDPTGAGEHTFTCSGGCSLSANTTYFLVLKGDSTGGRGFNWDTTASTDQTNTPGDFGWTIADAAMWHYSNAWHAQNGWTGIFKVSATPNPPSLTSSNVSATTATLTIGGHSGDWYYKATSGPHTACQGPVAGTAKKITGLTANTPYTYSAYSDSACTTANLLATAAEFTTPTVTLTSSNVAETTATLTIANHDSASQWWYDADTNPYDINCNRVSAGTTSVNLVGLTKRTEYVFYAYDATGCSRDDVIATADAFTTTGVALSVSNLSVSGATLGIEGHTAQWWYKANTGPDATCQGPVAAGTSTKALTDLTAGTLYTYDAYGASGCTGTALASVSFTAAGAYASNLDKTTATDCTVGRGSDNIDKACATGFTTGNSSTGYTLSSVTARFAAGGGSPGALVVAIHAESGRNTNRPASTATVTLSGSGSTTAGLQTFTCSGSACDLDRNSTYFVVMTSPSTNRANNYYAWTTTTDDGQTVWPASSGWAIANGGLTKSGSGDWSGMSRGATNVFQVAADPKSGSVSNLTAASDGFGVDIHSSSSAATAFTTKSHSAGYTLNSVTIKLLSVSGTPGTLTVAVHAVSGGNPASTATHTLSGTNPPGSGEHTFTCSGGCDLPAGTYFLVLTGTGSSSLNIFTWDTTASGSETSTPSGFDWTIADKGKEDSQGTGWADATWTGIFKVSATPK